jgi:hypothetical protein
VAQAASQAGHIFEEGCMKPHQILLWMILAGAMTLACSNAMISLYHAVI